MKTISLLFIIFGVFGDEVKSVSVMEGDSVTLHTDTKLQTNDVTVVWTFGAEKDIIAQINKAAKTLIINADVLDGRFRDRLQVNDQTGDLIITNITTQHSGVYEVDITIGRDSISKSFHVDRESNPESDQLKSVSVKDADSVTLHTDDHYFKKYDEILWRFQGIPIAQLNKSASEILEDKRFRDKLQPDVQTGSLKIKNIRMDLSGLYEADMTIGNSYTVHQSFTVTVSGEVKSVSAMKGDPVTIYIDVPDIKTYDQILLIFGCDDRIAEANKQNKQFTLYGKGRDRLKLNDQTGDLTITNIKTEDAGDYELKMSSRRRSIQRRFRVNVSERGLSPGAIAGISIFLILLTAAAAAAGVIYYRRKIAELLGERLMKVYEGESVDLKTKVKDIKRVDVIEWRFGETLIAKINPANHIFSTSYNDEGLFKDKLELNDQTGDLNINDIREEHTGDYTLKIIRDGETSYTRFSVFVHIAVTDERLVEVYEGESVRLKTEVTDIQRDDVMIKWTYQFENRVIDIIPANNIFSTYDCYDGEFRDRLHLDPKTGDLIISDITWVDRGYYTLKITRGGKTSYMKFLLAVKLITRFVFEGESVNLKTEVNDTKKVDLIEWRFEETLIAEINPANKIFSTYDGDDDLFKDKLKVNHQTGDLTINGTTLKHGGGYYLKIIRDGKTSYKGFSVCLKVLMLVVDEGGSINLETVGDIQRDDVIEWRFGDKETLIAEINRAKNIFSTYDGDDGRFRGKLKLNYQTGLLNIHDFTEKHDGTYKLKIIRDGEIPFFKSVIVSLYDETEEEVYMTERSSVDLKSSLDDIKRNDLIEWRFGRHETLIAEISPYNNIFRTYDGDDDLFRGKLKLNHQTGDLNINDIRQKHAGVYTLKIIRDGRVICWKFIISTEDPGRKKKDPVRWRTRDKVKREGDSEEKRPGDLVEIEIQPLLPKSSQ